MEIFVTSDHHFDHANVIGFCNRPFKSVEEMNLELIRRWNAKVRPEDVVLYLGDFSLSRAPLETCLPLLNGQIHLIAGNHDRPHPAHSKRPEKRKQMTELYLERGFASVNLQGQVGIYMPDETVETVVDLHHMPYRGDHTADERYREYRPVDRGRWLLHGHVHESWLIRGRQINVGVDVWDYEPASMHEIKQLMLKGRR